MLRVRFRTAVCGLLLMMAAGPAAVRAADGLEAAKNATVFIESRYRPIEVLKPTAKQLVSASGTGFIIADEGLILTNAHVVETVIEFDTKTQQPANDQTPIQNRAVFVLHKVIVRLASGTDRTQVLDATVLAVQHPKATVDLALLRVYSRVHLPTVPLADKQTMARLKQGVTVRSLGFPLALNFGNANGPELVMHAGGIAALHHDKNDKLVSINHDAKIDHGNSGGPLVDDQGRVVGINTFGKGRQDFSIPAGTIRQYFGDVIKHRVPPASKRRILTVGNDARATYGSVREAIKAAKPGDTVLLGDGQYVLDGEEDPVLETGVWLRGLSRDRTTLVLGKKVRLHISSVEGYAEMSDLTVTAAEATERNLEADGYMMGCSGSPQVFIHDLDFIGNSHTKAELIRLDRNMRPQLYRCRLINPTYPSLALGVGTSTYLVRVPTKPGPTLRCVELSGANVVQGATFEGCVFLPTQDVKSDGKYGRGSPIFRASYPQSDVTLRGCLRPAGSVWHASGGWSDFQISRARLASNVFHYRFGDPESFKTEINSIHYEHAYSVLGIWHRKPPEGQKLRIDIVGNRFYCDGRRARSFHLYTAAYKGPIEVFAPGSVAKLYFASPDIKFRRNYFMSCKPIYAIGDGRLYDGKTFTFNATDDNIYNDPTMKIAK